MSAHVQTGRTQRMLAAAIAAAKANPSVQHVALFRNQQQADDRKKRDLRFMPKNLSYMGVTRTVIGRINWGAQTVTIEGRDWPAFFDHDVVEDMMQQMASIDGQWNSKPGEYGYVGK